MIHRFWSQLSEPDPLRKWSANVVTTTQGDACVDWDESSLEPWLVQRLRMVGDAVHPMDVFRHWSNIVRYELLYTHGGVWMDNDLIPLRSVWAGPPATAAHADGTVCTCFMRFPREHPLLREALFEAYSLPISSDRSRRSENASGERLIERLAADHEIERLVLPFDSFGRRTSGELWAVHLNSASRR